MLAAARGVDEAANREAARSLGRRSMSADAVRHEGRERWERQEARVLSSLHKAVQSVLAATATYNSATAPSGVGGSNAGRSS
eukprot:4533422-Prymnesium_polylepis.1